QTQTGDRAELDLPENFGGWADLSSTADNCLGARCQFYEPCFVTRTRRRAEEADLLVVNHHLFFADLALRSHRLKSGEGVLPKYDVVIFDEAHALERIATEYFGCQVSNWRLQELCTDALRAIPPADDRHPLLSAAAVKLQVDAEALVRAAPARLGLSSADASVRLQ